MNGRSVLQVAGMIQSGAADPERIAEETLAAIAAGNEPGLFTVITADRAEADNQRAFSGTLFIAEMAISEDT